MSSPRPGSSPPPPPPGPVPAEGGNRLRLTRARLQALIDTALDPLALLDVDGTILYASRAFERTLGYGRRELAGRGAFELVHPDDLDMARASFDRAVGEGPVGVPLVVRCRTAGDAWRTLAAEGASYLDDPQVGCVVVSARDVTDDVLADELLRERETRLRALAEKFPLVLWTTDRDLQLTSLMGAGLAGVEPPAAGEPAPDALGGAAAAAPARDAHARALEGVSATFGFTLGDRRFEAHVEPLRERGEIAGVMGIALDVTGRVLAERRLRVRERELRDAQKLEAIGRLAAGIAHDFNNILTGVLGNASLLLHKLAPDDPSRAQAEAIERVAVRGAEMVGELLAFSRRQVARPQPLDVNDVVHDAEQLLRRFVPEGVEYVADLDERLGLVHADAGQLERVLVNLVGNACDAMPGGGRLTIATRNVSPVAAAALGTGRGPHVAVSVADTGTGIDEETLPQVFEPFFTTKRMGSGTGLGLPTARGIVGQAGGTIRVDTEVGRGSTFTVYLPCGAVEARAAAPAPRGADAAPAVPATVLVVDDDEDVRNVVARTLLAEGYAVRAAADGAEALAVVEQEGATIDVLVTDLAMPGIGGSALAARILQLRPGLPVVFMSATGEPVADSPGAREGVAALLPKPFTADELVRALARALEAPPVEVPPGDERWSPTTDDLADGV